MMQGDSAAVTADLFLKSASHSCFNERLKMPPELRIKIFQIKALSFGFGTPFADLSQTRQYVGLPRVESRPNE